MSSHVLIKGSDARAGYSFVLTKAEWDLDGPIVLLAVEDYSPIFLIEDIIHVDFIEIIVVPLLTVIIVEIEHISLAYFAIGTQSGDSLLHFCVSVADPIIVVFFAASNPQSPRINEISKRFEVYIAHAW